MTRIDPFRLPRLTFLFAFLIFWGTLGFAQELSVEFDREADFSKYMRYTWKTGTPAARPEVHQTIVSAIDGELQSKGRMPADREPTFFVLYHGSAEKELSVQSWGYTFGEFTSGKVEVKPIRVGTLVVDLIDAASGKLVWRGMVKDVLHTDPRKVEKTVRTRVAEMFKKFPPLRLE